ncbi:MAG: ester cyclase [Actinomycetota bacterium]|nr:ester cyclase [Actinomycetota bacterium]MDQ3647277.1 ester cyclase [Actinomycetota bacterium]
MADQNTDLMRQFYDEVMNKGDLDRISELCTEDVVDHEAPPDMPKGIEGVKAFVQMFREGFPDLQAMMEDSVAEGDRVAARVRFTGTHDGEFMGVPASGNRVDVEAIDIVRIVDGKCAEHWGVTDNLALMQQIGAIPEEAPA